MSTVEFWARSACSSNGSRRHHWKDGAPVCGSRFAIRRGPCRVQFQVPRGNRLCKYCVRGAAMKPPRGAINLKQYRGASS